MNAEPRTTAEIVSDLLDFAVDHEWGDDIHLGGDHYEKGCGDCRSLYDVEVRNCRTGEHEPDCRRAKLFEEARAFVRVEAALAEERERNAAQ